MKKAFCLFLITSFGFLGQLAYSDTCMDPSKFEYRREIVSDPITPFLGLPLEASITNTIILPSNTGWHIINAPSSNHVFDGKEAVFSKASLDSQQALICQYKTDENQIITLQRDTPIDKMQHLTGSWQPLSECVPSNGNINDCSIN